MYEIFSKLSMKTPEDAIDIWSLYCKLQVDFIHIYGVAFVDFEQENVDWVCGAHSFTDMYL